MPARRVRQNSRSNDASRSIGAGSPARNSRRMARASAWGSAPIRTQVWSARRSISSTSIRPVHCTAGLKNSTARAAISPRLNAGSPKAAWASSWASAASSAASSSRSSVPVEITSAGGVQPVHSSRGAECRTSRTTGGAMPRRPDRCLMRASRRRDTTDHGPEGGGVDPRIWSSRGGTASRRKRPEPSPALRSRSSAPRPIGPTWSRFHRSPENTAHPAANQGACRHGATTSKAGIQTTGTRIGSRRRRKRQAPSSRRHARRRASTTTAAMSACVIDWESSEASQRIGVPLPSATPIPSAA